MTLARTRQSAPARGGHACLLYDDPVEQLPALLPFIGRGLERGEQCIYVVDDLSVDELRRHLDVYGRARGIDIGGAIDRGALQLWTRREWRQPGGLDCARKSEQVRAILRDARAAGRPGVRVAVEMTWTLVPDIPADALRAWEATLDDMCAQEDGLRVICQYSRRRLTAGALGAALSTHPLSIVDTRILRNPHFEGHGPPADAIAGATGNAPAFDEVNRVGARSLGTDGMKHDPPPHTEAQFLRSELFGVTGAPGQASGAGGPDGAIDEAIGLLSHELRTPVATILGSAQILSRLDAVLGPEDRTASVTTIVEEALRLGRLLDDLFVLAHVEEALQLVIEPVALRPVLEQELEAHRRRYPERQIQLAVDVSSTVVAADLAYTRQILGNLLAHAERYGPPASPILVFAATERDEVAVRVIDAGPRVQADDNDLVFMAFSSAAARSRRAGSGLAAAKRLVEVHGGRIWTRPHEDWGTEFGFTLPIAAQGEDDGD